MVKYEKSVSFSIEAHKLNYILTAPDDIQPGEKLPLIVFLHGAGERGDNIEMLKVYCVPKLFTKNPSHLGVRAYTLSPQCLAHPFTWYDLKNEVMALIDEVIANNQIDPEKVSLCGISMGGFGTWELAMTHPHRFYKIAPLCSGGMSWRAWALKMPVRAFHGKRDDVVPYEYSTLMVNAVKACGGNAELITFDDLSHNCWDRAFEETDLIKWLVN
ncbi:MAG: dienelactone hydrolase family protein [Clostridia bacterium]|nr:dienelactone hydrolase family protein [Clostridia bacterium]